MRFVCMISGCNLWPQGLLLHCRGAGDSLALGDLGIRNGRIIFFLEENKWLELGRRRKMTKRWRRGEHCLGLGDEGLGFDGPMGILTEMSR